ncbi:MAG: T9SS type A sorting domain-containing protein, partial [Flavobacteriales bacterium]
TLSFPNGGQYFDNFTYNCSDTSMYGLIRTNYYSQIYDPLTMTNTQVFDSATVHLGKVNALTGEVSKVSSQALGVNSFSVNGSSTIDPIQMIYYFISGSSGSNLAIYGVSLQTGLLVSQSPISGNGTPYFDMIRIQSDCYESRPTRLNPVALTNENINSLISVFPNPFTEKLHFSSEIQWQSYRLLGMDGKLLKSGTLFLKNGTIDLEELISGAYVLQLISNQGTTSIPVIK